MLPTGQVTGAVASVVTSDREYPKTSTLHVSWAAPVAYFATGVGANFIEDAIYAVNLTTGAVIWKHTLPAGAWMLFLFHSLPRATCNPNLCYTARPLTEKASTSTTSLTTGSRSASSRA